MSPPFICILQACRFEFSVQNSVLPQLQGRLSAHCSPAGANDARSLPIDVIASTCEHVCSSPAPPAKAICLLSQGLNIAPALIAIAPTRTIVNPTGPLAITDVLVDATVPALP